MPLTRMADPWNDPDWLFELKYDGFRAIAYVGSERTRLVSRKNVEYRRFAELAQAMTAALAGRLAILDGEIVCLNANGAPQFYDGLANSWIKIKNRNYSQMVDRHLLFSKRSA